MCDRGNDVNCDEYFKINNPFQLIYFSFHYSIN